MYEVQELSTQQLPTHDLTAYPSRNSPICKLVNQITRQPNYPLTCQLVNLMLCQLFSANFNIMSALFANQLPTLSQKIDSRGGLFRCKKWSVVHTDKMNFYLNRPSLTPVFGRFAAKRGAFWCKMRCVLMLNAVRFGAKCNAFWC